METEALEKSRDIDFIDEYFLNQNVKTQRNLIAGFNLQQTKQAKKLAIISGIGVLLIGYILFFAAGLTLVAIGNVEVGVPIASLIVAVSVYAKLQESVVRKWELRLNEDDTIKFLNNLKTWLKKNMPLKYQQENGERMSYLYYNESGFFLMTITQKGHNTVVEFQSDNNLKRIFWSFDGARLPDNHSEKTDEKPAKDLQTKAGANAKEAKK